MKKKHSEIQEPTQPERARRFVRRNSVHILHCRSGSLNKMPMVTEQLNSHQIDGKNVVERQNYQKREREPIDFNNVHIMDQFGESGLMAHRTCGGSMKIERGCRQKTSLSEKYQQLRKSYNLKSQQFDKLEAQCRSLKVSWSLEHSKRQNLQEKMKMSKEQMMRLEKYRCECGMLRQGREIMLKHIEVLELAKFDEEVRKIQSYREKVLEDEVYRLRESLQRGRGVREKQLMDEVESLREQNYNISQLNINVKLACNVLTKQLEQSKVQIQKIKHGMHQTVIQSLDYINLQNRYRQALVQLRSLRVELTHLNHSDQLILSHTFLSQSQSILLEKKQ